MLKVGINENVKLVGAEINDKGSLQISFKDAATVARKKDLLDSLANTKDFSVTNFIIWPVKVEGSEGDRPVENIGRDLGNMRDQLEQILEGFVTTDKANIDPYAGLDTTDATAFQNSLKKQGVVDQIYKSMTTQFVSKVKEIVAVPDQINRTFRLKLIRTSKAKHFGTIPKSFVRDNPFFESMTIPVTSSKVAFTSYEKKNGLDNPDEVTTASADKTPASTEVSAAASILGRR